MDALIADLARKVAADPFDAVAMDRLRSAMLRAGRAGVSFDIPFTAVPKANKHKIRRRGGTGKRFVANDLDGTVAMSEASFVTLALAATPLGQRSLLPIKGPVLAEVTFTYPVTASWPAWQQRASLDGSFRMTKTPDLDNVAKFVWDSLEKVFFDDDKQICRMTLEKIYGPEPRVAVNLTPIEQAVNS